MGKTANYLLFFSGIGIVFYYTGLLESNSGDLLSIMLNVSGLSTSSFFSTLFGITALAGGAIAGFVTRDAVASIKVAALTGFSTVIISIFLAVVNRVWVENSVLASVVFGPLAILLLFSLFEWIGGTD